MKITINKEDDFTTAGLFHSTELELKPGITILVGHNGAGKTTLINILREKAKEYNYYFKKYDNYNDGGSHAIELLTFQGQTREAINRAMSSEGQNIIMNFASFCHGLGAFIGQRCTEHKPIIIALDALDSGFDAYQIQNLKSNLDFILNCEKDKELYFIVSANSYSLAKDMDCVNVIDFTHHTFPTYDDYEDFICKQYPEAE